MAAADIHVQHVDTEGQALNARAGQLCISKFMRDQVKPVERVLFQWQFSPRGPLLVRLPGKSHSPTITPLDAMYTLMPSKNTAFCCSFSIVEVVT